MPGPPNTAVIEALKDLNLSWPPPDFDVEAEKLRLAQA